MRIAYKNYIDLISAGSITTTSDSTDFPISRVQDQRLGYTYRSTVCSAVTVTVDLTSLTEMEMSTFALLGHNLTSSASIIVEFMNIDDGTANIQEVISWNSGTILKFFSEYYDTDTDHLVTEDGVQLITESEIDIVASYGFTNMQIQITDPTNPAGYIELGRIWIGDYINVSPSSLLDFKVTKKRSDRVLYGRDRQKFAIPGVGWRAFSFSFPKSNSAMIDQIYTMYKYVGNNKSFIFANFDEIRGYSLVEPTYVSLIGDLVFKHKENMSMEYQLTFEEDK